MIQHFQGGKELPLPTSEELVEQLQAEEAYLARKLERFIQVGYTPHPGQILFHCSDSRTRVAGAGRRGGKTISAAFEMAYLCHPEYQLEELRRLGVKVDQYRENETIVGSIVVPETKGNNETFEIFFEALEAFGIKYKLNQSKGIIFIYGANPDKPTTRLYIKSGNTDATSRMRGAGYSFCWWDEPAFIKRREGWDAFESSLDDYNGCMIATSSPADEEVGWWFYDEFIEPAIELSEEELKRKPDRVIDPEIHYLQWFSEDNPIMVEAAKKRRKRKNKHLYRREYEARWERGVGSRLMLDWLHFFSVVPAPGVSRDLWQPEIQLAENGLPDRRVYDIFIGIDPAISEKGTADWFVACVLAKHKTTGQGYVIEMRRQRLTFPEQLDLIEELNLTYRPIRIDIESVGYQRALKQQAERLPSLPPVWESDTPVTGKEGRLEGLGPIMRSGMVKLNADDPIVQHLITEWIEFPNSKHDDTLDALDIVIRASGIFVDLSQYEVKEEEKDVPNRSTAFLRFTQEELGGSYSPETGMDEEALGLLW